MANLLGSVFTKIFGDKKQKDIKNLMPYLEKVKAVYPALEHLNNDELRTQTDNFRAAIAEALSEIDNQISATKKAIRDNTKVEEKENILEELESLEEERNELLEKVLLDILPQAFAVIKETARRFKDSDQLQVQATDFDQTLAAEKSYVTLQDNQAVWQTTWSVAGHPTKWNMVHYDVQLIGGIVLHQGKIAEMATGEGKTLVATLPMFLNGLAQRGVHIVTVNDYLAKRDAEWMAPILEFHGLRVDCIDKYEPHSPERIRAYEADITYGTNNEFGFDYLRDNMSREIEGIVQRKLHFAIVDEVDSVLVDDARTPLIISGPMVDSNIEQFKELKPIVDQLVKVQRNLVNKLLNEAKTLLQKNNKEAKEAGGLALLRASRAFPKYRPLIKYLSQEGNKKLLEKVEAIYLAENAKRMPEVDEMLYFTIEEKNNLVELTDKGLEFLSSGKDNKDLFVIPDIGTELSVIEGDTSLEPAEKNDKINAVVRNFTDRSERVHTVQQLLKSYALFEKDVDYIIESGKIKIVDEQTGRVMEGRRYSDGLHQALEAKENVNIEQASQTYATITLQNYFRMYHKLSGMTGTAETEAGEFWQIYKLDVVVIPTNEPIRRQDQNDKIYKTIREKYGAVVDEIQAMIEAERPVLVGTTSVSNSEIISKLLKRRRIPHQVLNAKLHQKEAEVVALAGQSRTVTIATNMAGRGTDIKLSSQAREAGGLAIIGTERHESRRVDRQLRGRSGRQGDKGSTRFFISLEDDLMRLFASGRIAGIMDKLGLKEGEVIEHKLITNAIERAQKKVEENNFGIRKRLLEYDDVMNMQRKIIYKYRHHALIGEYLTIDIYNNFYDIAKDLVADFSKDDFFKIRYRTILGFDPKVFEEGIEDLKSEKESTRITEQLFEEISIQYNNHRREVTKNIRANLKKIRSRGIPIDEFILILEGRNGHRTGLVLKYDQLEDENYIFDTIQREVSLELIDHGWKEHLRDMDYLKQESRNASFEQKDPLLTYKLKGFDIFAAFLKRIKADITMFLFSKSFGISLDPPRRKARAKVQTFKADSDAVKPGTEQTSNQDTANQKPQPIRSQRIKRNQRVKVRYKNGKQRVVKYKMVERDLVDNKCVLVK